jgi:hypothetical protein
MNGIRRKIKYQERETQEDNLASKRMNLSVFQTIYVASPSLNKA